MIKKLIRGGVILGAALAAVAGMSAYEAHVINVTAHIENALGVSAYGIDYGTVFPQENHEEDFTVSLSQSFIDEGRVDDVEYVIKQKSKQWRDEFDGVTHPEHRELSWVDPDNNGSYTEDGKLNITTGNDIEDLFGPNEQQGDWTAPRKVMLMGGNFEAKTHVFANPGSYYEAAGLLAYGQDGDLVRLEVTNWGGMGKVVYMESQELKVKVGKKYASLPGYGGDVYLKLTREGDLFRGYHSSNGTDWDEVVTVWEGKSDMDNPLAGKPAMVGVSVVRSNPISGGTFTGSFDYLDMNGKYQDFCRFLSKVKDTVEGLETDVNHPSYYLGPTAGCIGIGDTRPEASGVLSKLGNDEADTWVVDLKVPPIAGYVGQDWPESCRQDWVVPSEADYGCDLWVEVTGISENRPG